MIMTVTSGKLGARLGLGAHSQIGPTTWTRSFLLNHHLSLISTGHLLVCAQSQGTEGIGRIQEQHRYIRGAWALVHRLSMASWVSCSFLSTFIAACSITSKPLQKDCLHSLNAEPFQIPSHYLALATGFNPTGLFQSGKCHSQVLVLVFLTSSAE
jgi:hypothetical protein